MCLLNFVLVLLAARSPDIQTMVRHHQDLPVTPYMWGFLFLCVFVFVFLVFFEEQGRGTISDCVYWEGSRSIPFGFYLTLNVSRHFY